MMSKVIENDIEETTNCLVDIINCVYQKYTHNAIKGYLVPNPTNCIISEKERKNFSASGTQTISSRCYGSVKCSETQNLTQSLTAMLIAYSVKNNLIEYFKEFPFKNFKIELETYPKYRMDNTRFIKYRKTGGDITFLKVNIEW